MLDDNSTHVFYAEFLRPTRVKALCHFSTAVCALRDRQVR